MERAEKRAAKAKKARELSKDDLARIAEILNNGISQRKVAEAMGVSQSFICRFRLAEALAQGSSISKT